MNAVQLEINSGNLHTAKDKNVKIRMLGITIPKKPIPATTRNPPVTM